MSTLQLNSFSFTYPAQQRQALDRVSITIRPSEVTWLTGALGSGTSTLLLALAGLAPRLTGGDASGSATLDDADVTTIALLGSGVAYLGPSPALQLSGIARTVRDEVAVGPMNLGWPAERARVAVDDAMEQLGVTHLQDRAPASLSGGETQRVLLAALLAAGPHVWLLDEPFAALDHASAERLRTLLRTFAAAGQTVVVTCDDADEMLDVADRLIVMERGRVALDGDPAALLAGDELLAAGAGSSDAATLAAAAQWDAPRPVRRDELLQAISAKVLSPTPGADGAGAPVTVALQFDAVTFSYPRGVPVLRGMSFLVRRGEAVGLFGSNGAGKSTALRLAMALERVSSGRVVTLGSDTKALHPEDFAPAAGFLFQQPERQLFASSVRAECSLAPALAGWTAERTAIAVAEVLDELGLADTAKDHPYDLPLPRRRLVALAAILAADPQLILLDEPTAGLDFASRERVIETIRRRRANGRAVLAITHDAGFAHEALDRGLVLQDGVVVHDGLIRDVIDDHRLRRPAALAVAVAAGFPPGADRRKEVAQSIRRA